MNKRRPDIKNINMKEMGLYQVWQKKKGMNYLIFQKKKAAAA